MSSQPPNTPPPPPPPPSGPPAPPPPAGPASTPSNGTAVAGLVLGIVATVIGIIPPLFFLAIICGILGLIFGIVGLGKSKETGIGRGQAIAGIVLGSIGLALGILWILLFIPFANEVQKQIDLQTP